MSKELLRSWRASPHWEKFRLFSGGLADPLDWALEETNWGHTSYYRATTQRILGRGRFTQKLSQRLFAAHSNKDANLYICSDSRPSNALNPKWTNHYLFAFDIDDKDGTAGDVDEVAGEINRLMGFCLPWEVSTHGRGRHGWLIVNWKGSTLAYRDWADSVKVALNQYLEDNNYKAHVDVQGQPPLPGYEPRGKLIKAPRLPDRETFDWFFSSLRFVAPSAFNHILPPELPEPTICAIGYEARAKLNKASASALELLKSADPWLSSCGAVLVSLQRHRENSTSETAQSIYEAEGQATGPSHAEREKRFQRLHNLYQADFNPEQGKADPDWFNETDIANTKRALEVSLKRYRHTELPEGLDVDMDKLSTLACLVRKNIKTNRGACSYESIRKFFAHFKRTIANGTIGKYLRILRGIGWLTLEAVHMAPSFYRRQGRLFKRPGLCCVYSWGMTANHEPVKTYTYEEATKLLDTDRQELDREIEALTEADNKYLLEKSRGQGKIDALHSEREFYRVTTQRAPPERLDCPPIELMPFDIERAREKWAEKLRTQSA